MTVSPDYTHPSDQMDEHWPTITPAPKPEPRAPRSRRPIPRGKPPARSSKPIARKKEVVKINRRRKAKNHERAYGQHAAAIRRKPCCACGYMGLPSEAAHTASGGKGRKADASTLVPLCTLRLSHFASEPLIEGCHRELHRIGVASFEKKYRIDLKSVAADLWSASPFREREGR